MSLRRAESPHDHRLTKYSPLPKLVRTDQGRPSFRRVDDGAEGIVRRSDRVCYCNSTDEGLIKNLASTPIELLPWHGPAGRRHAVATAMIKSTRAEDAAAQSLTRARQRPQPHYLHSQSEAKPCGNEEGVDLFSEVKGQASAQRFVEGVVLRTSEVCITTSSRRTCRARRPARGPPQ